MSNIGNYWKNVYLLILRDISAPTVANISETLFPSIGQYFWATWAPFNKITESTILMLLYLAFEVSNYSSRWRHPKQTIISALISTQILKIYCNCCFCCIKRSLITRINFSFHQKKSVTATHGDFIKRNRLYSRIKLNVL